MSYDVDQQFFWRKHGKEIHLYRLRKGRSNIPDNKGRLSFDDNELIYPDENITDGLRIEYTPLDLTSSGKTFVDKDATSNAQSSLTAVTGVDIKESTHVNVNRMLSLAIVDYVKSMVSEKNGDIQMKEYYMREFYKKLADNQSNNKRIFVSHTNPLTAVR